VKINLGRNIKTFLSWAYNLMKKYFAKKKNILFWTKKLMEQKFQKIKIIYKFLRIMGSDPISLGKRDDKCEKA
jgi:hypothetical protein